MRKAKEEKRERYPLNPTFEQWVKEENDYRNCKKPVSIGWTIFGLGALSHFLCSLIGYSVMSDIPEMPHFTDTLESYKYTEEYNDYVTETQKEAVRMLTEGEITFDEYTHIVNTVSSDENFAEFLRSLKDDKHAMQIIAEYDEYAKQVNDLGKTFAGVTIAGLSGMLIGTLILAKYRMREMEIEEVRKKREEVAGEQEKQM